MSLCNGSPDVSVVVPARNASSTICDALRSILLQEYSGDVEIIVADGSDDENMAQLIRHAFPTVTIVLNPDRITSAGLNRAIAASSSDVIVRCDAAAVLMQGYLQRAVETLQRTGAANVGGRQLPIGTNMFQRAVSMAMVSRMGSGNSRYKVGGQEGEVDTVYMGVFRRDALLAIGGFDETIVHNQDYEVNWRLRQAGEKIWFDPKMGATYKPRRNFLELSKQYFNYGRWKMAVLKRHPRSLQPRQLAAPALLLGLLFSVIVALLGVVWPPLVLAALLPVMYICVYSSVLYMALLITISNDPARHLLPSVWATMHISWGVGFFVGILKSKNG